MKLQIVLAALLALSACNTFEGAGRDVSRGGEAISDAAVDTDEAIQEALE